MGLFHEEPKPLTDTGGISYMIHFSFGFPTKPFFKKLQEKLQVNDEVIEKIGKALPRQIEFKVESYANQFNRVKVWHRWTDNSQYFEYDYPEFKSWGYPGSWGSTIIYSIFLELEVPEIKGEAPSSFSKIELSYSNNGKIGLCLKGGAFGEKHPNLPEIEPLDENIIFSMDTNNFKELEKYHLLNVEPDTFYEPSPYHRAYQCGWDEAAKTGFWWSLNWYSWTSDKLPKIKYDESGKCIGHSF